MAALHVIPDWTVPYLAYMNRGELPEDETLARQIIRRSKSMTIINGELHHCSVSGAFQRCVSPEEGCKILREIHEGDCGHHAGSKSLVAKAFRHGFYWLTAHADAEDLVKRCDGCQKFSRRAHVPTQELRMIPITWPFATSGLDMVGPFKRSKDKKTHLLVAVDKFTKWVEAEPVSKCDAATAMQFIKKVIFRFGFPHSIITDNGTNLSKGAMKEFCEREHIRLDVSSVAHPQSNGQAERANKEILQGIKPRLLVPLQRTPGCWVEELPSVLWSINTTPNRST